MELITAYPLFGCGLGAYEPAMLKYNASHPLARIDYAHNDYLQLLAELGAVGFLIAAALAMAVLSRALRVASFPAEADGRYLGLGLCGCDGGYAHSQFGRVQFVYAGQRHGPGMDLGYLRGIVVIIEGDFRIERFGDPPGHRREVRAMTLVPAVGKPQVAV